MAIKLLNRAPTTYGPYHVVKTLGKGGTGTVYQCRHLETDELVAIKVLAEQFSNHPILQKRFEQEFRVTRALEHPNIVRTIALGREDNHTYLVMEFVEGNSLADWIDNEGALSEAKAVRLITQVGQAIDFAHKRGIIHRDIKPENILIRPDGRVKVTDFGLGKDTLDDQGITAAATGLGTPQFMAPEQFTGAKNADLRCDIYSLAATLYTAVTGQMPFNSCKLSEAMRKKLTGDFPPPRKLVPALSEPIDAAIRRGMSAKPEDRPASCLEFLCDVVGKRKAKSLLGPNNAETSKGSGADRRAFIRHSLTLGTVCGPSGETEVEDFWPVTVVDVSQSGIGLSLARRFEPGTELVIEFHRPGSRRPRKLTATVVRVVPKELSHWVLGCAFDKPLADDELQVFFNEPAT